MTSHAHPIHRTNGWRIAGWSLAAALLALPAVAMQFTAEVNWTGSDFVFAAVMFGGVGLMLEVVFRRATSTAFRAATGIAIAAAFALVWINAAVGIIGSEQDDANLLYAGVLLVVLAGAVAARFHAAGMARTMIAAAVAQVAVPPVAAASGLGLPALVWSPEVMGLTGVLAAMWLVAAWLFGRAALTGN